MHRGNVGSMLKWDMFVINSFFGFQILQLGMMGTSVIISSGDKGVAGANITSPDNDSDVCQNSTRMSWAPWRLSCFVLTFVYKDRDDANGINFNPSFPVSADLAFLFLMTHCSTSGFVSIRNVCRSNPNESRIYGRWPGGSCEFHHAPFPPHDFRQWLLELLRVRLLLSNNLTRTLTRSIT